MAQQSGEVARQSKKNLSGGKGHKRSSNREMRGHRKNREITTAFVEDFVDGEDLEDVTVARVIKALGSGRMEIQTLEAKSMVAAISGSMRCSKGAARRADNPIALSAGCFVILQQLDYNYQIVGALQRHQVKAIREACKGRGITVPHGFFEEGAEAVEDGFEWDLSEEGAATDKKEAEAEVDIDTI